VNPQIRCLAWGLALALLLGTHNGAEASPQAPATPSPAVPPPGTEETQSVPELRKLTFLVGDWAHAEVYHAGPQGPGGPGAGRSKVAWLLGDHFLYVLYATRGPWGHRESRGFLSWDVEAQTYRLDWYDDLGNVRRFSGVSPKAGELSLVADLRVHGQNAQERALIRHREDGKLLLTLEIVLPDRKPDPLMEAVLNPLPASE
jgi:hypothetical protein